MSGAVMSSSSTLASERIRTPWSEFWRKFRRQKVAVAAGKAHQALQLGRLTVHLGLRGLDLGNQLTHGGEKNERLVESEQSGCHEGLSQRGLAIALHFSRQHREAQRATP